MKLHWPQSRGKVVPTGEAIHVWAVPLGESAGGENELAARLTDVERQRAASFIRDEPRLRFLASRAALRTILGRLLELAPADVPLGIGPGGKPLLTGAAATSRIEFNLTHSGSLALVAATVGRAVGVDVEALRTVRRLDEIARRYFSPEEGEAVLARPARGRTAEFFRCWTRKEAVLKTIGAGLGYPLEEFTVPTAADAEAWIDMPATKSFGAARCWLTGLTPCDQYVGAVACQDERRPVVGLAYTP